jgi:hypothetical protein
VTLNLRRTIWSEYVEPERIIDAETLRLLASRSIGLHVAITPEWFSQAARVVLAARHAGVRIGLWPMIDDDQGRWANGWNAEIFKHYTLELLSDLERERALPDDLVLDLEPPIASLRRAVHLRPTRFRGGKSGQSLIDVSDAWRAAGVSISAAVLPLAATGPGRRGWQRLLGTPLDAVRFDRVSSMLYTTIFEGYSRGFFSRDDAEGLLFHCATAVREQYGDAGSVSVGLVGVGALGDEAVYRSVAELARDVAIVSSAGVRDLALYDLSGVLARPPAEAWLDVFCGEAAVDVIPVTRRGRWSLRAADWLGRLLSTPREFVRGSE